MAQERPVLRCQHRVRSGASGMTSGVPSVCRTEPARTNPDVQYNSQYAEERVNRSHNPTHLERGTSTCNHDETYRNRPPAYVLRSMVRRRPKTSTHETHAKRNDNTNTRCLNWLMLGALPTSPKPSASPTPSPTCDSWSLVRLCDIRQPTERGRRARTQAAWSFVSRVSRRVRARAGVADERGVTISHRFRSFGARSTPECGTPGCARTQNRQKTGAPDTGHRTGPDP